MQSILFSFVCLMQASNKNRTPENNPLQAFVKSDNDHLPRFTDIITDVELDTALTKLHEKIYVKLNTYINDNKLYDKKTFDSNVVSILQEAAEIFDSLSELTEKQDKELNEKIKEYITKANDYTFDNYLKKISIVKQDDIILTINKTYKEKMEKYKTDNEFYTNCVAYMVKLANHMLQRNGEENEKNMWKNGSMPGFENAHVSAPGMSLFNCVNSSNNTFNVTNSHLRDPNLVLQNPLSYPNEKNELKELLSKLIEVCCEKNNESVTKTKVNKIKNQKEDKVITSTSNEVVEHTDSIAADTSENIAIQNLSPETNKDKLVEQHEIKTNGKIAESSNKKVETRKKEGSIKFMI